MFDLFALPFHAKSAAAKAFLLPYFLSRLPVAAERAAEKPKPCHSERSEESLFISALMLRSKRDSSLRSE
jgi:hypothetical protein